jgi:hypothetical protein
MPTDKPPGLHPLAWAYLCHEAADYGNAPGHATHHHEDGVIVRGRWTDAGCPLLDDEPPQAVAYHGPEVLAALSADLDEPPKADAALLAVQNQVLCGVAEGLRAELEKLREEYFFDMDAPSMQTADKYRRRAEEVERERDEARAEVERLRAGWAQDERSLRESDAENERLWSEVERLRAQLTDRDDAATPASAAAELTEDT